MNQPALGSSPFPGAQKSWISRLEPTFLPRVLWGSSLQMNHAVWRVPASNLIRLVVGVFEFGGCETLFVFWLHLIGLRFTTSPKKIRKKTNTIPPPPKKKKNNTTTTNRGKALKKKTPSQGAYPATGRPSTSFSHLQRRGGWSIKGP